VVQRNLISPHRCSAAVHSRRKISAPETGALQPEVRPTERAVVGDGGLPAVAVGREQNQGVGRGDFAPVRTFVSIVRKNSQTTLEIAVCNLQTPISFSGPRRWAATNRQILLGNAKFLLKSPISFCRRRLQTNKRRPQFANADCKPTIAKFLLQTANVSYVRQVQQFELGL
jgi:hypothetical protein